MSSKVLCGDCLDLLSEVEDNSVDLIFTSPPCADIRKNIDGAVHPDDYVSWFMPRADELYRVLKPDGTFILCIKEKVVDGERHTYVIELTLEMRKHGWLWTEEFLWHKKNCYSSEFNDRFINSWKGLLQFNKQRKFKMYQEEVMVPVGDWAKTRLKNLSDNDKIRKASKTESGFGSNVSNWINRDMVYPTNVLHLSNEDNDNNHSNSFPDELVEWFIKLFTTEGDTVLDPFMGSGNTLLVAQRMGRNAITVVPICRGP
jgi:site-specific DNA-methyltransferase (adenine-specific)